MQRIKATTPPASTLACAIVEAADDVLRDGAAVERRLRASLSTSSSALQDPMANPHQQQQKEKKGKRQQRATRNNAPPEAMDIDAGYVHDHTFDHTQR